MVVYKNGVIKVKTPNGYEDIYPTTISANVVDTVTGETIDLTLKGKINRGEWYTVVNDYGVVGDGVTDVSDKIQAVIDAVHAKGGGTILFLSQTYIISKPIVLRENITIRGIEGATIKLKDNCNPKPFSMLVYEGTTANNIHFENITVDGNRVNNIDHGNPDLAGNQSKYFVGTLLALINLTNVSDFSIKNCIVRNSFGSGIWITDCENGIVSDNHVHDYRSVGIAIRNSTQQDLVNVNNINIVDNKVEGGTVGIHNIFGVFRGIISGNQCFNNRDANRFPSFAYLGTYPNVYPTDSRFNRPSNVNYVSPAFVGDGAGIEFTGMFTDEKAKPNDLTTITNNMCFENMVGIRIEEQTSYITISSNVCSTNDAHGIFVFSSRFISVTGNQVIGNKVDGIRVEKLSSRNPSEHIVIVSNICALNNEWGVGLYGVRGFNVAGNNLSRNNVNSAKIGGGVGLYTVENEACIWGIISDNLFINYDGLDQYGIYTADTSNTIENTVQGNIFKNQSVVATNLNIKNNLIRNNIGYKSDARGVSYIPSTQNTVVVQHGLPFIPYDLIQITANGSTPNNLYVTDINATTFTVKIDEPPALDLYFNWFIPSL